MMHVGFRLGLVAPVNLGVFHQESKAQGDMDKQRAVFAARFQQQNPATCFPGETIGEGAPGRTGSHNDVIVRWIGFDHVAVTFLSGLR